MYSKVTGETRYTVGIILKEGFSTGCINETCNGELGQTGPSRTVTEGDFIHLPDGMEVSMTKECSKLTGEFKFKIKVNAIFLRAPNGSRSRSRSIRAHNGYDQGKGQFIQGSQWLRSRSRSRSRSIYSGLKINTEWIRCMQ